MLSWGRRCCSWGGVVQEEGRCCPGREEGGAAQEGVGAAREKGVVITGNDIISPPPHGQTDACENIILPQTSFTGGNNTIEVVASYYTLSECIFNRWKRRKRLKFS